MNTTFSTTFVLEDKELIREDALHNVVALQEEEGTDNNQVYISTSLGVFGFGYVASPQYSTVRCGTHTLSP
jgi:hypothetical protein